METSLGQPEGERSRSPSRSITLLFWLPESSLPTHRPLSLKPNPFLHPPFSLHRLLVNEKGKPSQLSRMPLKSPNRHQPKNHLLPASPVHPIYYKENTNPSLCSYYNPYPVTANWLPLFLPKTPLLSHPPKIFPISTRPFHRTPILAYSEEMQRIITSAAKAASKNAVKTYDSVRQSILL